MPFIWIRNTCAMQHDDFDASQDEKDEKCRKWALTGDMGLNPVRLSVQS